MQTNTDLIEAKNRIRAKWWVFVLWGITMIALGIYYVVQPALTTFVMFQVVALYLCVGGLIDVMGALLSPNEPGNIWRFLGGGISLVVGLFTFVNPLESLDAIISILLIVLVSTLAISGLIKIFLGSRQRGLVGRRWTVGSLLVGGIQVLIGLFLLEYPIDGTFILIGVLGVVTVIGGDVLILFGLRVRQLI